MRTIEFAKLSGSGNDFVCIDNLAGHLDGMLSSPSAVGHFAKALCRRGLGVGADGVIFACRSQLKQVADIDARFFESDGSEVELCGNGIGCFVHWAVTNQLVAEKEVKILTPAGVVKGENCEDGYVRACIPDPEDLRTDLLVPIDGKNWRCDYVVTGVPHVITYVEQVDDVDVAHWGPALRHHERFGPRGVNVNFVQVCREGQIAIRTYEFGVEGETLACGTGSAAAAILTAKRFGWSAPFVTGKQPVLVNARSGDVLRVYFTMNNDGTASDVCLETIVRFSYSGTLHPDLAARALAATAET